MPFTPNVVPVDLEQIGIEGCYAHEVHIDGGIRTNALLYAGDLLRRLRDGAVSMEEATREARIILDCYPSPLMIDYLARPKGPGSNNEMLTENRDEHGPCDGWVLTNDQRDIERRRPGMHKLVRWETSPVCLG